MKSFKTAFTLIAALAITLTASAQQQAPASKKQEPQKVEASQASPKDAWVKQYNEWKPKVDHYMSKVKENGDKYPEFTKEVTTLSQMASAYNQKIARWDIAKPETRANYAEMMDADAKQINDQMAKVKGMYEKNWPSNEK